MYDVPYGDTQQLNLDWFIEKWKEFYAAWQAAEAGIDGALDAEIEKVENAMTDLYAARDAAAASATAAASSATAASTSATTATNAATSAAASATIANNKAAAAGLSEANAATSASSAATSAASASTDATAAGNSASAAATSATNAATSANAAATSETNAATSETNAAASANDAADSVQEAENVLASIPEDYSELSNNATALISAFNALSTNDYNIIPFTIEGAGRIRYDTGAVAATTGLNHTDYIDVSNYARIKYKRCGTTGGSGTSGMAFYDENFTYLSGIQLALNQATDGYLAELHEARVPLFAKYARFSTYPDITTYGNFEIIGYSKTTAAFNKIGTELILQKAYIATGGVYSTVNNGAFLKVNPNDTYEITAPAERGVAWAVLKSVTFPIIDGTTPDFSDYTGFRAQRSIALGTTETGKLPPDAQYIYFYYGIAGTSDITTLRLPIRCKINGVDILDISGTITENVGNTANNVKLAFEAIAPTIANMTADKNLPEFPFRQLWLFNKLCLFWQLQLFTL